MLGMIWWVGMLAQLGMGVPMLRTVWGCVWSFGLAWSSMYRFPSRWEACWWGISMYGVPLLCIAWGGATLLDGSIHVLRLGLSVLSIGIGCVAGVWWWMLCSLVYSVCTCCNASAEVCRLVGVGVGTAVWWIWCIHGGLCWLGMWIGLPMLSPIIPLANSSLLRPIVTVAPHEMLILCELLISNGIVWYIWKEKVSICVSAVLLVLCVVCVCSISGLKDRQGYAIDFAYIPITCGSYSSKKELYDYLCSETKCNIMGLYVTAESAVHILEPWASSSPDELSVELFRSGSCFIGGLRLAEKGAVHNAILWVHDGLLIDYYDKRVVVPGPEAIPWSSTYTWLRRLCLGAQREVVPGTGSRPVWQIGCCWQVTPYVCSELFCAIRPERPPFGSILLALCNISWAVLCIQRILLEYVRFCALSWNCSICYVSGEHHVLVFPTGDVYDHGGA